MARGKAAGLYVTRSELTVNRVDTMSKDEVLQRMQQLYYDTGGIFPAGKIIEGEVEEGEEDDGMGKRNKKSKRKSG